MTYIDASRLLAYIEAEAQERHAAMKPDDPPYVKACDLSYLEALETVSLYVTEVSRPGPTFAEIEKGAA